MNRRSALKFVAILGAIALAAYATPQSVPSISVQMGGGQKGTGDVATTLQILALLTVLSLAPALLMLTTAFTRIVIIFSFLRSALGAPSIPPNQVLVGLSMFLTFFIMTPTWQKVNTDAVQPLMNKKPGFTMAMAEKAAEGPIKKFMLKNTYDADLRLFMNMRHEKAHNVDDLQIVTLIPAFIISELKTAFIVGFYIYIPFLIIDLIVASSLMSMGMMMMPPTVVSLPAKLLVFVLADGWGTLIHAILSGYR